MLPSVQLAIWAARSAGHLTLFRLEAGPMLGEPKRFWLMPKVASMNVELLIE